MLNIDYSLRNIFNRTIIRSWTKSAGGLIRLPAGKGKKLKKDLEGFIAYLTRTIPALFESEDYQTQKKEIIDQLNKKQKKIEITNAI